MSHSLSPLSRISFSDSLDTQHRRPPNVVLVLTDDQGYGDLGCHGNKYIKTPYLDNFYQESSRFTNFYSCPLCSPTRASLLTGRYNYRTGVIDTWVGLAMMRSEEITIAEKLKEAGYKTGIFGKWHLGDHYPLRPIDQGFDESLIHKGAGIGGRTNPPDNHYYDPILYHNETPKKFYGYCTDIFFQAAIQFIEKHAKEPFFVYIPTNVPHVPLEIKEKEVLPYLKMGLDEITAKHYAMLTNLDQNFGRLLSKLDELDLSTNTIVIFTSDNGPAYRDLRYNAGLREGKGSVYDGGIKVPFFIRWPKKIIGGKDIDRIAHFIDVFPTLIDLCDISDSKDLSLDGISLAPLLLAKKVDWPDRYLFFQQSRPDPNGVDRPRLFVHCAVRSQNYKIVMTSRDPKKRQTEAIGLEQTELYDMLRDPGETLNIARSHPHLVRKMRLAYEKWFNNVTKNLSPVSIYLGSPLENPVILTNQDLYGPGAVAAYVSWGRLSRDPQAEPEGFGVWHVKTTRAGRYKITLRFGPLSGGREVPLKEGIAVFKLGKVYREEKIKEGSPRVSFFIELPQTEGALETYFTGQRKDGAKVTPFFVDIEFIE